MEGADLALLHRLVAMGSRSLLQYVCQAVPWSADSRAQAIAKIQDIAAEERDATARLTRHLQKKRLRLPPHFSFPSHFTTINFVSIDYLLPRLIAEHESEVAELEGRLAKVECEEVRDLAQHYLDRKRRDLQSLKDLTAKSPAA
jgi:hypothetical protein